MPKFRRAAAATVFVALIPSLALACLWDYDTLKMERQRFPTTLELITGKFLRHSPEFYEWRIRDREAKLAADPNNLAYLDDLAGAYDKIGKPEKAIEVMHQSAKVQPVRYETESNIALFFFHAGQLETSLRHVENALKINPDAHFGREKYQKYLTEYVISRRVDGKIKLPLAAVRVYDAHAPQPPKPSNVQTESSFDKFLTKNWDDRRIREENPAAIKGVAGMMRFADHKAPILLESLGTLLSGDPDNPWHDGKRLSARAFLKASYEANDDTVRRDYRLMATRVINMQTVHPGTNDEVKGTLMDPRRQEPGRRVRQTLRRGSGSDVGEGRVAHLRAPEASDLVGRGSGVGDRVDRLGSVNRPQDRPPHTPFAYGRPSSALAMFPIGCSA